MERLAKYIARRGICSRRAAERLIVAGNVSLNGVVVRNCATFVADDDKVIVSSSELPETLPTPYLFMYHKPTGLVTSHKDSRPTVFDDLPLKGHVISVGRLDINTSGLLLFTNNGQLARYLELPSSGFEREYHVLVQGKQVTILDDGGHVVDELGIKYVVKSMKLLHYADGLSKISVVVCEGKNHEVRNIIRCLKMNLVALTRVRYGPFALGELPKGGLVDITFRLGEINMVNPL